VQQRVRGMVGHLITALPKFTVKSAAERILKIS